MPEGQDKDQPLFADAHVEAFCDQLLGVLRERLAVNDKPGAVAAGVNSVRRGLPIPSLYLRVLTPLLAGTGSEWQHGLTAVWQEHLVSAVVRTIVESLYADVQAAVAGKPRLGTVAVLACPPEEAHDLGLRMVADLMELGGWTVHFLGADTPVQDVVAAARGVAADAVVLSASTHFHRVRLRRLVDDVAAALPGVKVWVGGPAFAADDQGCGAGEVLDVAAVLRGGADLESG
jgi:MerR family transcriptional regulator, light-induced transcriptional regulator